MSEAEQIKQLKETIKNFEMEMTILRAWYNQANREVERLTEENRRLKVALDKANEK